jgi:hypothetical protein
MQQPPFRFTEQQPESRLRRWILTYWEFQVGEGAPATHHVPPDGCTSLLMALRPDGTAPLVTSGPWTTPLVVPATPGQWTRGIRLAPGAAALLLGVPAEQLVNRVRVVTEAGVETRGDVAVLALPARATAALLAPLDPALGEAAGAGPTASLAVVGLGYRASDVPRGLDAYGFLALDPEALGALACVFESSVFAGRAYDTALLAELPPGVDPCGEGGEFHTFVWDGPPFSEPLRVRTGETLLREERFAYTDLVPEDG